MHNKILFVMVAAVVTLVGAKAAKQTTALCGAPHYYCMNHTTAIVPNGVLPSLPHAGSMAPDPNFGTMIHRLVDLASCRPGFTIEAGLGGSMDVQTISADNTRYWVEDTGGVGCVIAYNPVNGAVSPCGVGIPGGGFDTEIPGRFYSLNGTQLSVYDFTNCANVTSGLLFDFASDPNCGASVSTMPWKSFAGYDDTGTIFSAMFGTAQNVASLISVYQIGKGCWNWNTATAKISGIINTPVTGVGTFSTGHNAKMDSTGTYVAITHEGCTTPCSGDPIVWEIHSPKGMMYPCQSVTGLPECSGHWVIGPTALVHNGSPPAPLYQSGQWLWRPYSNFKSYTTLIAPFPNPQPSGTFDAHAAWPNTQNPIFVATMGTPGTGDPTYAFEKELLVVPTKPLPIPGPAGRAGHLFNSLQSSYFSCKNAIGACSHDGRYCVVTSDWEGTLGNDKFGQPACDVFLYDLSTAKPTVPVAAKQSKLK